MSTYRLPSPYERTPLQRRASGLALALALNLGLLLLLLTLGRFAPEATDVPMAMASGRIDTVNALPAAGVPA